ncbi:MAG: type II toxin-antitoxin system RelB/DinJ family antitoxin [Lachnospiraceae bacterium]|nr:type II toxin-antitoxin system RelB/DinJ family antitoxin [Lachnospiraceae bacterium]
MATVSTNVKIDQTLKQEAQELFESFGLSLSSAINIFLRQSVREQAIPFRVGNPLPNMETIQAIEDARKGIGLSRGFTSVAELMEDLDADDQISDHI